MFDLPSRTDKSKPRAIESVLVELQRCVGTVRAGCPSRGSRCKPLRASCSERELRRERGGSGFDVPPDQRAPQGSYDIGGDGTTTNLFVSGLAASVDEHALKLLFGRYGPIASVKVMWPRQDEEARSRGRLSGFVAFMTRRSAEQALEHLNGCMLHDCELRLGWGKAVPLPATPVWPLDGASQPPWLTEPAAPQAPTSSAAPTERLLTEAERRELADIMEGLTTQRSSVRAAMTWALDRAEAAREVSASLAASLKQRDTPPLMVLARLFLLSDVLHNSCSGGPAAAAGTPRASFRDLVGRTLPEVFASLRLAHEALQAESRLSAAALRRRVLAVLHAWAHHGMLFSADFVEGLEYTFMHGGAAELTPPCAELQSELSALDAASLRRRARQSGLPATEEDDNESLIASLFALAAWRARSASRPSDDREPAAPPPSLSTAHVGGGSWTTVP